MFFLIEINSGEREKNVSSLTYYTEFCNLKEKQQQQIEGTPAFQELIRRVKIITHGNHARPLQSTQARTCAETVPSSGGLLIQRELREERTHLPVWETWARSLGWKDPLEKEMATHSSILAWRAPWTEEPGRLQSRGSRELDTTEHTRMRGKSN